MRNVYTLIGCLALLQPLWAQTDTLPTEPEEDFSMYENMNSADGKKAKTFCTQKVLGQTPSRLVSVGYEFFGPYELATDLDANGNAAETESVRFSQGLRLEANIPVISRNDVIWNVGGSYSDQYYQFKRNGAEMNSPLAKTLDGTALRNFALQTLVFKPLDEKNFLLGQVQGEYAGNWGTNGLVPFGATKVSGTLIYGRKTGERSLWGVGLTRTYRAGEVNYLPVFLFNHTAKNQKWGVEMLLPARADFRYSFSPRNLLRLGLELEGTSYRIRNDQNLFAGSTGQDLSRLELKRSDIRLRAIWDVAVRDFYWASLVVGYRLVYRYNLDEGREVFRGFGLVNDKPYFAQNDMGGALFVGLYINFVSP